MFQKIVSTTKALTFIHTHHTTNTNTRMRKCALHAPGASAKNKSAVSCKNNAVKSILPHSPRFLLFVVSGPRVGSLTFPIIPAIFALPPAPVLPLDPSTAVLHFLQLG